MRPSELIEGLATVDKTISKGVSSLGIEDLSLFLSLFMWNDVDRGTVTLTRTSLRILRENRSHDRSIALLRGY